MRTAAGSLLSSARKAVLLRAKTHSSRQVCGVYDSPLRVAS